MHVDTSTPLPLDRGRLRPISVAELFTIGIGPSSSHTVGPMRAAFDFAQRAVGQSGEGAVPTRITCDLYGSLALTGRGHATDTATILGLAGWEPERLDPDEAPGILVAIAAEHRLALAGTHAIAFAPADIVFHPREFLPEHPNGMTFTARRADGGIYTETYFSIGGGAILRKGAPASASNVAVRHPFTSGAELLRQGEATGLTIAEIVRANESAWRDPAETDAFLDAVRTAMHACIDRGIAQEGVLPGGLKVRRRARAIEQGLTGCVPGSNPAEVFEWVSLWALAVNEENAAGGRVVTAPTNGAAGVLPAVLRFYETLVARDEATRREGARVFLLTAAAIGMLYKKRASISAAEMGCQGEVGVACSMAAGALAAVLGGSNGQIENAAEIGMEHNLGLTCDPIGGLVQIPCIERNTMGAVKAINAAYLALRGDGSHVVSLDAVIETMRQTGEDMRSQYKETSLGGLAVNVVEC
ncbi:L-serine ammonia-lyase [Sphingomonas melonis]|uniref:L-serine ammonia-lyase n=1 Tax=Sphingomonas melonis TaxID=152682 RepID=UPI001C8C45BF|nr:L-serine ammonia-lyase [Sphingomonas melonis]MBX8846618.1 L-serine ammonia-lyase [Sphingomonas melonis]MBX8855793.1 L-serine ammonia-lyase [Sphingomonas melonis]MBX8900854.1 L-serine ammonia-lyase [Sphingomonas melonis]